MKIFFNGWFSGFFEKTNPGLHVTFFLELFEKVYLEKCEVSSFQDSDILCEFDMLINTTTALKQKKWLHTFLFSGESSLKCKKELYTCVLWGERNHKNVVNLPLFVAYTYSNGFLPKLENKKGLKKRASVPKNDVCVIISNPGGQMRNAFLNELEKNMNVCYAGRYRNNIGGRTLKSDYNTKEFLDFVGQFKFIVSMENSKEDTYITEKIVHGMLAHTIPIYWGSDRVHDYFNPGRFVCLEDDDIHSTVQKIISIKNDDTKWLEMVNSPVFTNARLERTLDAVAQDIRCILKGGCWSHIERVFCVCNPEFEPDRYEMLTKLFASQNIRSDNVHYISSTYKHTITEDIYNKNINDQLVLRLRRTPMKKGELSLFLNYKEVLEYIVKNYKDGIFLIFESDAMLSKDVSQFNDFMDEIKEKDWGIIHIGSYSDQIWREDPNINGQTGYKKRQVYQKKCIEDITDKTDKYRLSRKYHTRCTDSFVWRYHSINTFLNHLNVESNFGVPFDYYLCNFLEHHNEIKHYWSENEFFKQGSNLGLMPTTLQN